MFEQLLKLLKWRKRMKKVAVILMMIICIVIILPSQVFAADLPITVMIDNSRLYFPEDEYPFLDANGRTQTPAKYISEALGATVSWDGKQQKATFTSQSKELILYIGKTEYAVDGQIKQMDTAAIIKNSRTFVPAKYIAEAFGATIKWDAPTRTVSITSNQEPEDVSATIEYKDVASGTTVNNRNEFINAIKLGTKTLQPKLILKCSNYSKSEYNLENLNIEGIYEIKYTASILGNFADVTITLSYTQSFKIQQAEYSKIALSRITTEEKAVIEKINEIIAEVIKDKMTDYEKELAIHNYLVLNYKYDYDNYIKGTLPDQSYTPYGLLINGTGVCQAYAEAAKLLLNKVGIDCEIVTGTANGGDHAWNIVKINNEYYMLDITWDDPAPDKKGEVRYNYFNVSADQLSQDHIWDTRNWPVAKGTEFNYYNYNNLVVNNYQEFKQFVINKINEGKTEILVYVNGYNKAEYDLNFIFDYYIGSYSYSIADNQNTPLTINLE